MRNPSLGLAVVLALLASSCNRNEDARTEAESGRFTTPEQLVAYLQTLNRNEAGTMAALVAVSYAENDLQRTLLEWDSLASTIIDLDLMMRKTLGVPFDEKVPDAWEFQFDPGTIVLLQVEAQRATGRFLDAQGKKCDMHLVKVADEWWVSGYTQEYLLTRENIPPDKIDKMLVWLRKTSPAASGVLSRLRSGEELSADDIRRMVRSAVP